MSHGQATRRAALRMLRSGTLTMRSIAEICEVSTKTIYRWRKAADLPARTNRRLDPEEVRALDAKWGPNAAAEILGCSPGSIHYHRGRHA